MPETEVVLIEVISGQKRYFVITEQHRGAQFEIVIQPAEFTEILELSGPGIRWVPLIEKGRSPNILQNIEMTDGGIDIPVRGQGATKRQTQIQRFALVLTAAKTALHRIEAGTILGSIAQGVLGVSAGCAGCAGGSRAAPEQIPACITQVIVRSILVAGAVFVRHRKERLKIGSDVITEFAFEQVSIYLFRSGITIDDAGRSACIRRPDATTDGRSSRHIK